MFLQDQEVLILSDQVISPGCYSGGQKLDRRYLRDIDHLGLTHELKYLGQVKAA